MAQRDYVRKNNKSKNNGSRVIPNIMMAIAVILVILFVAILYVVSTNKSKPIAQPPKVTEKPQTTLPEKPEERWTYLKELENPEGSQQQIITQEPQVSGSQQSVQEKERQKILDSFANDKSTVTSATTPQPQDSNTTPNTNTQQIQKQTSSTKTATVWLQCGAFKEKSNAESLKAKLAMNGVTSSIKSEAFHRVMAGPYNSKAEAEKAIMQLKSNGISSCITTTK